MRLSRLASVLVTLLLFSNQILLVGANVPTYESTDVAGSKPGDMTRSEQVWRQFRETFPLHIQTVAFDKESRTLIISEPPPHVSLDNLKEALQRYNPTLKPEMYIKQHTIGVDGWVKDIVFQLPPLDAAKTHDALDAIQEHLFQTTYKAY